MLSVLLVSLSTRGRARPGTGSVLARGVGLRVRRGLLVPTVLVSFVHMVPVRKHQSGAVAILCVLLSGTTRVRRALFRW